MQIIGHVLDALGASPREILLAARREMTQTYLGFVVYRMTRRQAIAKGKPNDDMGALPTAVQSVQIR